MPSQRSRPLLAPILCALVLGLAAGVAPARAQQPPAPPAPPESYRYRINVQLVLVPVSVSVPTGEPVTSLDQSAFEALEDGQPRPIKLFEKETSLPLQLALLVDASLSAANDLKQEKEAMVQFIQRVLRPNDAAALYQLSGKLKPLAKFSDSTATLEKSLRGLRPGAGTALYDAIIEAASELKDRQGRRALVLITDGNDTTSKHNFHDALRAAQEAELSIFSLLVRPIPGESGRSVRGEHVLQEFADMTGGRVFFPGSVTQLDRFFDELSEMLRTQYLIGYEPLPPSPRSEFRTIEIKVKGQDYVVRHRTGYYTEAAP